MPRALRAAMGPANSSCNCRAMARPSMSSAAIVQNLNLLDIDYRRVSPPFIEAFLASDDDAKSFVAAEVEIGGVGEEVIYGPAIVRTDEFVFGGCLDAESAANDAFALNNALGWRFGIFRRCVGGGCRRLGGGNDGRFVS